MEETTRRSAGQQGMDVCLEGAAVSTSGWVSIMTLLTCNHFRLVLISAARHSWFAALSTHVCVRSMERGPQLWPCNLLTQRPLALSLRAVAEAVPGQLEVPEQRASPRRASLPEDPRRMAQWLMQVRESRMRAREMLSKLIAAQEAGVSLIVSQGGSERFSSAGQSSWECDSGAVERDALLQEASVSRLLAVEWQLGAGNSAPVVPSLVVDNRANAAGRSGRDLVGFASNSDNQVPMAAGGGVTTLMLRNIPQDYDQAALEVELQLTGCFDILYLPRTSGGKANLRYAFVNFVSPGHAAAFRERWQRWRWFSAQRAKPLSIIPAQVQGFEANLIEMNKSAATMASRRCGPILYRNGVRLRLADI